MVIIVVHCIGIKWLMISTVVQCTGFKWLYDKYSCAMRWNETA